MIIRDNPEIRAIVSCANSVIENIDLNLFDSSDRLVMGEVHSLVKAFYSYASSECLQLLKCFCENHFDLKCLYQRSPYLRISHPSEPNSYTKPHCDTWYGHSVHTIAIWVPLTACVNSEALSIYDIDSSSYVTPKMDIGDFILFGGGLKHGTFLSQQNDLRMSLDFRFHPIGKKLASKKDDLFVL